MLAIVATLALLTFAAGFLFELVRHDGGKILAALQGRSWLAERPMSARPVTVRYSPRYPATRPMRAQAEWRAAA